MIAVYSSARRRFGAVLVAAASLAVLISCVPPAAIAASPGGISGTVKAVGGDPIAGAEVLLEGKGIKRFQLTDAKGGFTIAGLPAGTYLLDVVAPGYERPGLRAVDVLDDQTSIIVVQLARSTSSLTTLGHVTTHSGEALSTSAAPSREIDAQAFAASGNSNVADMLADRGVSVTIVRPAGGNPAAPAALSLRGPDPTETLFDIDGHSLNSGGSGAFDVSLLDAAQLSSVQLVYGIAPSSLIGPNTIDGTVNVRTLDPTQDSHGLLRFSLGSFSAFGETAQVTGTNGNVGYALSLHRQTTAGETDQQVTTDVGDSVTVGSAITGNTALAKFRIGIGDGGGTLGLTLRDQSAFRDLSAALSSIVSDPGQPPAFADFAGSSEGWHNAGYGLDLQLPVGRRDASGVLQSALVMRHLTSIDDRSVDGPATGTNAFLLNDRDVIQDDIVEFDRVLPTGSLAVKFDIRSEDLQTQVTPGGTAEQIVVRHPFGGVNPLASGFPSPDALVGLAQTQRSAAVRYTLDSAARVHYELAAYFSDFSSFGSSLDPRFGVVWMPTAQTAIRASIGTTFQSPQLPELYVPPVLPPPDANGFFNIGNPHMTADRATDYGLGIEHVFGGERPARLAIDLYRTNLRDAAQRFVPSIDCNPPTGPPPPPQSCLSFPINLGGAVYRGVESSFDWSLGRSVRARATYVVNSAYPSGVPPQFQGGTLGVGEQFIGVPLQSGSISVESGGSGVFTYDAGLRYAGKFNELNRPAFATLRAGVTWHQGRVDVGLYGTNLRNVYDDRFTLAGRGVPYPGLGGPVATDAFSLQGRALSLVITNRM